MNFPFIPNVLTIAGSDSGGGAGIQADIKAISATGSFACSVITATTAQNTLGVIDIHPIPTSHIAAQLDAIFSDITIHAVKIGMLADSQIIDVVADKLEQYQPRQLVLDPVMVATSGDTLLKNSAIEHLKRRLIPLATLITPNLPEAYALVGQNYSATTHNLDTLVGKLSSLHARATLLKGGHSHSSQRSDDYLVRGNEVITYPGSRVDTQNTHGTGCTLSSAIASFLAQEMPLTDAVQQAKTYITQALTHSQQLDVGKGHGPVDHFYMLHQ